MYKETIKIPPYTGDTNAKISVGHLFDYLINTSSLHTESIGLATERLLEKNISWMVYQVLIKIKDLPKIDTEVTISTWVSKVDKLKIYRQVNVKDQDGNLLIESCFIWLLVDIEKMKVIRPIKEVKDLVEENEGSLYPAFRNFRSMDTFDKKIPMPVYKSDIDYNKHVHSGTYLRWVTDLVDIENDKLREVELYFKDQIFKEDQVEILQKKDGQRYDFQINKNNSEGVFASCLFTRD